MRWGLCLALALACGDKKPGPAPTPSADAPDVFCPGGPGCANNDGLLEVGAALRSAEPACYESFDDVDGDHVYKASVDSFLDCGCDRLCSGDAGYPGPDEGEGDGVFQAVWIAGFNQSRAAQDVRGASEGRMGRHDGLWVRAVVLRQGDTSLGIVAIDAVGWMYDQVLQMRQAVADSGVALDHLVVHSTHTHEGPDTMGIWGPNLTTTGFDPDYAAQVAQAVAEAIGEASRQAQPVQMRVGSVDTGSYHARGTHNLIRDSRDPWIVDETLQTLQFVASDGGDTVATLINWANHPETVDDSNNLLTSDYAHALREVVESGVSWQDESQAGVGGVALLINGTVGGMMTSLGVEVEDPDGGLYSSASFDKADTVGMIVGGMALDAVASARTIDDPKLSFAAKQLFLPIVNQGFQSMFVLGVLGHRKAWNYDPSQPITDDNQPDVLSEVDVIDLGPLRMVTVPGEMLPELAIGGFDGSHTPDDVSLIKPDNPNPPDLSAAPSGAPLKERMGGEYNWVIGLGNDETGYLVPAYDFQVDDVAPYIFEAEGDHYEETNSLGPQTAPLVLDALDDLMRWKDAG